MHIVTLIRLCFIKHFLKAGIAIPAELPYQDESQRENSARMVVGKGHQRHESVSCEHLQPEIGGHLVL